MAIFTAFPPINKSWSWTNQWQAERCHDKHLRSPTTCLCVRGGRGTGSTIKKGILKDLSLTYQMNIHNSISHKLPFILMFVFFFPGIHPPQKMYLFMGLAGLKGWEEVGGWLKWWLCYRRWMKMTQSGDEKPPFEEETVIPSCAVEIFLCSLPLLFSFLPVNPPSSNSHSAGPREAGLKNHCTFSKWFKTIDRPFAKAWEKVVFFKCMIL